MIGFPDDRKKSWRWLSERELEFIRRRVDVDRGDAYTEPFSLPKYLHAGLDLKVWGFGIIFCCFSVVIYALQLFLPIILNGGMGFSVGAAQYLVAPPYAFAGLLMFVEAWVKSF